MLSNVIQDSMYVKKIIEESSVNTQSAENYMHFHIEDMFPEITKSIQHRRAQYYLLVHEYHFVESLLKKGQIEQKEADTLIGEIDSKIFYLQTHTPEITLLDQKNRI